MRTTWRFAILSLYITSTASALYCDESSNSDTTKEAIWVSSPHNLKAEKLPQEIQPDPSKPLNSAKEFLSSGAIPSLEVTGDLVRNVIADYTARGSKEVKYSASDLEPYKSTVVLHIVKWKGDRSAVQFEKWYVYRDYGAVDKDMFWETKQSILDRKCLPGVDKFLLVYIYLKDNAEDYPSGDDGDCSTLKMPAKYDIVVTKAKPTLLTQIITAAGIAGISLPPAVTQLVPFEAFTAPPGTIGYYDLYCADVAFEPASIAITATYPGDSKGGAKAVGDSASYVSESPNSLSGYLGLSGLVPVTSYKDVVFENSSGTLVPKSATRYSAYIALDIFVPPMQPALASKRWAPHPFFALPLAGKVFDHGMVGVAVGLKYGELYYGAVMDRENRSPTNQRKTVWKGSFGIKFSLDQLKTLVGQK